MFLLNQNPIRNRKELGEIKPIVTYSNRIHQPQLLDLMSLW